MDLFRLYVPPYFRVAAYNSNMGTCPRRDHQSMLGLFDLGEDKVFGVVKNKAGMFLSIVVKTGCLGIKVIATSEWQPEAAQKVKARGLLFGEAYIWNF